MTCARSPHTPLLSSPPLFMRSYVPPSSSSSFPRSLLHIPSSTHAQRTVAAWSFLVWPRKRKEGRKDPSPLSLLCYAVLATLLLLAHAHAERGRGEERPLEWTKGSLAFFVRGRPFKLLLLPQPFCYWVTPCCLTVGGRGKKEMPSCTDFTCYPGTMGGNTDGGYCQATVGGDGSSKSKRRPLLVLYDRSTNKKGAWRNGRGKERASRGRMGLTFSFFPFLWNLTEKSQLSTQMAPLVCPPLSFLFF